MRFPQEWYQMEQAIAQHFPELRPAQQRGLTLWVYGTILAQSACQSAVISALWTMGAWHALRQYLREWLYDGADKAAPCKTDVEVSLCFAPLLRWVLSWWQGQPLALAVDVTLHGEKVAALVVSVLYRGCAIPVAWHILPANRKHPWIPLLTELLHRVAPALPEGMEVVVMTDRGLWSPRLWNTICGYGWLPLMRLKRSTVFQPVGGCRDQAVHLVPGPGHAWLGPGTAFRAKGVRRFGTLLVVWEAQQQEPWVLLSHRATPREAVAWYGLRVWIELGFRALKGVGWQWQQTRRTNPGRVARPWLVLAVATLWVLAYGTRLEEAEAAGLDPARLHWASGHTRRPRVISVFKRGLAGLKQHLLRGRSWRRLWLAPEPWPEASSGLCINYHQPVIPGANI
jgi:hypothetical protein